MGAGLRCDGCGLCRPRWWDRWILRRCGGWLPSGLEWPLTILRYWCSLTGFAVLLAALSGSLYCYGFDPTIRTTAPYGIYAKSALPGGIASRPMGPSPWLSKAFARAIASAGKFCETAIVGSRTATVKPCLYQTGAVVPVVPHDIAGTPNLSILRGFQCALIKAPPMDSSKPMASGTGLTSVIKSVPANGRSASVMFPGFLTVRGVVSLASSSRASAVPRLASAASVWASAIRASAVRTCATASSDRAMAVATWASATLTRASSSAIWAWYPFARAFADSASSSAKAVCFCASVNNPESNVWINVSALKTRASQMVSPATPPATMSHPRRPTTAIICSKDLTGLQLVKASRMSLIISGSSKTIPTATRIPYTTSWWKYESCRDCNDPRTSSSSARINSGGGAMSSAGQMTRDIEFMAGIMALCGVIAPLPRKGSGGVGPTGFAPIVRIPNIHGVGIQFDEISNSD